MFNYTKDTPIEIDGKMHTIRMFDGMTGIGSRDYWIDGNKQFDKCVMQSGDLTKGNHFIYKIKWRDNPWSKVDIIVHEDEIKNFLTEDNKWREPVKREF